MRLWPRCALSLWEEDLPLCDALGAQLAVQISSEACAPSGQAVAARPPRAAQAQVSRPTRADRRDDGALIVTRAAHSRLRHQVAADRAELETAAQRSVDKGGGLLVAEHFPHAW